MVEKAINQLDLSLIEPEGSQECVTGPKRHWVRNSVKLQIRSGLQRHDYIVKVLQYGERCDEAIIAACARADQKIPVVSVIAINEPVEILLTDHSMPLKKVPFSGALLYPGLPAVLLSDRTAKWSCTSSEGVMHYHIQKGNLNFLRYVNVHVNQGIR